jgi:hypothetical protein
VDNESKGILWKKAVLSRHFPGETDKKHENSFRIVGDLSQIPTGHLPNATPNCYDLSLLAHFRIF